MTRSAILRRRFFWVLKHTLNRLTSRIARSGRGPFAVICHVGRKTGRTYETPVILAMEEGELPRAREWGAELAASSAAATTGA